MRLSVFGATGRTGRLVTAAAAQRGIELTALVRDPAKAAFDERVGIVAGDARDPVAVAAALDGADAVIAVMAIPEGSGPTTALSDATGTIVAAMEAHGPARLILTVNSSVFHDRPVEPPFDVVAQEHRRDLAILRASSLDWTALAPTVLTDDAPAGAYVIGLDERAPAVKIPRGDLAAAALDALGNDDWVRRVVGVSA